MVEENRKYEYPVYSWNKCEYGIYNNLAHILTENPCHRQKTHKSPQIKDAHVESKQTTMTVMNSCAHSSMFWIIRIRAATV